MVSKGSVPVLYGLSSDEDLTTLHYVACTLVRLGMEEQGHARMIQEGAARWERNHRFEINIQEQTSVADCAMHVDSERAVIQTNTFNSPCLETYHGSRYECRLLDPGLIVFSLQPHAPHRPTYSGIMSTESPRQHSWNMTENIRFRMPFVFVPCSSVARLHSQCLVQYWYVMCDFADDKSAVCPHPQHAQQER